MTGRRAEVSAVWADLVDLEVGERRHLLGEPVLVFGLGKQLHHFIDGTARDHLLKGWDQRKWDVEYRQ